MIGKVLEFCSHCECSKCLPSATAQASLWLCQLVLETGCPRIFCQFRHTTWTLLHVVSLLLLRDFGTLFHWTVKLLHPLTHLRSVLRHFSLIRHNRTVACASVLWHDINWLIDWLIDRSSAVFLELDNCLWLWMTLVMGLQHCSRHGT